MSELSTFNDLANLVFFHWRGTPQIDEDAAADATILKVSAPPTDKDGSVITGNFIFTTESLETGEVEGIYVPANAVSADGLTLGTESAPLVRGLNPSGNDLLTGSSDFAQTLQAGSPVACSVDQILLQSVLLALTKQLACRIKIDTRIGFEGAGVAACPTFANETAANAAIGTPVNGDRYYDTDIGHTRTYQAGAWATDGDTGTSNATEESSGKVELGTLSEQGSQAETGSEGPVVMQCKNTAKTAAVYTPAYLTGGSSAETNTSLWDNILDGEFTITIDGVSQDITGLDFSSITDMDGVAAVIQAGIRAVTGNEETCVWSTDHFIITSADTTSVSEVSVTSTVSGGSGTDISGAGADDLMDCDSGNGTATDPVLDQTQDENKAVVLEGDGRINEDFIKNSKQATAGEDLALGKLGFMETDGQIWKTVRSVSAASQIGSLTTVSAHYPKVVYLSDNKAVICYFGTNNLNAVAATIVKQAATFGSEVTFDATGYDELAACKIGTDKIVVVYIDSNDSGKIYGCVMTISGTTITAGTPVKLYDTEAIDQATFDVCPLDDDKFLVVGHNATSDDPIAVACTVSGTVITPGTAQALEAVTMAANGAVKCAQLDTDVAVCFYDDGTNVSAVNLTISGTTITVKTPTDLYAGKVDFAASVFVKDANSVFLFNFVTPMVTVSLISNADQTSWDNIDYDADGDYLIPCGGAQGVSVTPLGRNKIAVAYQFATGGVALDIYELGVGSVKKIFSDLAISGVVTGQYLGVGKLSDNGNKAMIAMREGGASNELKYSVFFDSSDQYLGVVKTAVSASETVTLITGRDAPISGLTTGQDYFVGDDGEVATEGTKKIGVATSTTNLRKT